MRNAFRVKRTQFNVFLNKWIKRYHSVTKSEPDFVPIMNHRKRKIVIFAINNRKYSTIVI